MFLIAMPKGMKFRLHPPSPGVSSSSLSVAYRRNTPPTEGPNARE